MQQNELLHVHVDVNQIHWPLIAVQTVVIVVLYCSMYIANSWQRLLLTLFIQFGECSWFLLTLSVCAFGHVSLCMYIMYITAKKACSLFAAQKSPAECFSLSLNASSVFCYVQRAVQTEQFMLFQIRDGSPLALEYFLLSFNSRTHPLGCCSWS